ncbi:hypothetical protein [Malacoplasma iowae]|uniref:Uncharacterized protein n=1 Tax=Malacoplasma iowae 695 TaxID=1048830 RepID=A0A6P1LFW0_MALIO|nr:hypothetical protein [Malacoplasma iowae]VEU63060.1 Uncharacterised protein [Mycoplasmopsis fermentans]QHG89510.1 hypothetical protein EER00_01175 [Malacoplasma iowae 695]WPL35715.1 hypothetical protein QX180_05325 [Malacoplasma iowae]WPL35784.1 hypothetical protein QX180_05695 [Malacoplasma iowae]VEU71803.1 Uncharacterised protein [Malacoplasma iowae]
MNKKGMGTSKKIKYLIGGLTLTSAAIVSVSVATTTPYILTKEFNNSSNKPVKGYKYEIKINPFSEKNMVVNQDYVTTFDASSDDPNFDKYTYSITYHSTNSEVSIVENKKIKFKAKSDGYFSFTVSMLDQVTRKILCSSSLGFNVTSGIIVNI